MVVPSSDTVNSRIACLETVGPAVRLHGVNGSGRTAALRASDVCLVLHVE
jgi:hypothetical protein